MYRHLSSLLALSVFSLAGYTQSTSLARTTGLTAAPAIRQLPAPDDTQQRPQSRTTTAKKLVSGTIKAQGSGPLEGVLVTTKDGTIVSGSMQDGQYYIEIPAEDSVLVFTLDGYATSEIKLMDGCDYSVTLKPADPVIPASPAKGPSPASASPAPFSALGPWRGVFELRPGVEVPFNFEIKTGSKGQPEAFFRNGEESFEGGRVTQTTDSFFIELDQYDNELAFPVGQGALTGSLRHQDKKGNPLTVRIEPGKLDRFPDNGATPAGNLSGTYDVTFTSADGKEEKVVGLFKQEGSRLTGTFLRVTGDSRYLEGIVLGNEFYLSSFYGSGPAYYKGTFTADGHLTGESVGARGATPFAGVLNPQAALPDPYKLTYLKPGYDAFSFSFPDVDGKTISLQDARFKNKVVIVTIGGTWCPNCVDEASFLAPWYKTNRERGIEVVSIQYERSTDTAFVRKVLTRMRDRYDIQYTQVFGGIADKQGVAASLPSLNTFLAFPTTIVIDRKGRVARIHTGYSGPATGPYYQEFLKEFNAEIDALVKG
jgi:peroxiredoxin